MMRNEMVLDSLNRDIGARIAGIALPRKVVIGAILIVSLMAFEVFNFDTTRFALLNLMGDVKFLGLQWAAILAVAFCSIDFAGLVKLFTPEKGLDEPKEVWYLMGAWLLGATMNALMTWWAVSLTLLNHEFGNEVLSRQQLLQTVPIFVAVLVWLTRILFIGAFTIAGDQLFDFRSRRAGQARGEIHPASQRKMAAQRSQNSRGTSGTGRAAANPNYVSHRPDRGVGDRQPGPAPVAGSTQPATRIERRNSRIRQRPPMPNGTRRAPMSGVQARGQRN